MTGTRLAVKDALVRRILVITAVSLAVVLTALTVWAIRSAPRLRDRVVEAINARFESQVSLGSLDADMFPKPRAADVGTAKSEHDRDGRRLAGAVWAEKREDLARTKLDIDTVERTRGAERLDDPVEARRDLRSLVRDGVLLRRSGGWAASR